LDDAPVELIVRAVEALDEEEGDDDKEKRGPGG
jgi:hypothetical protein